MKPERIAELRHKTTILQYPAVPADELEDLLATAEQVPALRVALEGMTELWLNVGGTELNPAYEDAIAILESKGGES